MGMGGPLEGDTGHVAPIHMPETSALVPETPPQYRQSAHQSGMLLDLQPN